MEADTGAPCSEGGPGLPSGHEAENMDATEPKWPLWPRVPRGPQMATVCPPGASIPALSSHWWKEAGKLGFLHCRFLPDLGSLDATKWGTMSGAKSVSGGQAARVMPDTEQTPGKRQFQ